VVFVPRPRPPDPLSTFTVLPLPLALLLMLVVFEPPRPGDGLWTLMVLPLPLPLLLMFVVFDPGWCGACPWGGFAAATPPASRTTAPAATPLRNRVMNSLRSGLSGKAPCHPHRAKRETARRVTKVVRMRSGRTCEPGTSTRPYRTARIPPHPARSFGASPTSPPHGGGGVWG